MLKICDSNLKILNVCAKFPGSTYLAYYLFNHIWHFSIVLDLLKYLHSVGRTLYFLLGKIIKIKCLIFTNCWFIYS